MKHVLITILLFTGLQICMPVTTYAVETVDNISWGIIREDNETNQYGY